jgi:hypothetical protein
MRNPKLFFLSILIFIVSVLIFQACKSSAKLVNKESVKKISYASDIRPMMQVSCAPCHFPALGKKKMLDTYEKTHENIKEMIRRVELPIDHKDFMPFKSKRTPLTVDQITMLKQWLAQDMPK